MSHTNHPLRIDIAVHGRFHAFHIARALLATGHDVQILTNYPKRVASQFGIPPQRVQNILWHGLFTRIYYRLERCFKLPNLEPFFHCTFGRWAAKRIRKDGDAVYVFSGVAEETLRALHKDYSGTRMVVRGSSHIRTQYDLLADEETRCGIRVEKPSDWIISREEREYKLADYIVVLSSFARNSFLTQEFSENKIFMLLSGVDANRFKPLPGALEERIDRLNSGEPLHILTVGTFSPRKGALDLIEIAKSLHGRMIFKFIGDIPHESHSLYLEARKYIEFIPRVREFNLTEYYSWGDIFCFPTIEDGYPAVLAQALTARLPVLTTPNCSGPDIVRDFENGWIIPIRSSDKFISRLIYCDENRDTLSEMIKIMDTNKLTPDWLDVANQLDSFLSKINQNRKNHPNELTK